MEIIRHGAIEKDLRSLKRFPAPLASLVAWERLFCLKGMRETPGIEHFPGLGVGNIFKARVVPLKENCGKSKGFRLIFRLINNASCQILVFTRHGIYQSEHDLIRLIKERIIS